MAVYLDTLGKLLTSGIAEVRILSSIEIAVALIWTQGSLLEAWKLRKSSQPKVAPFRFGLC